MHMIWIFIPLLLLTIYQSALTDYLLINPEYYQLDAYTWESDNFRAMRLGDEILSLSELDYDQLTTWMIEEQFNLENRNPPKTTNWKIAESAIIRQKPVEFKKLRNAYQMVFSDISCFPIPVSLRRETPFVCYEDGFGDPRTYGGERKHEGCDIMGMEQPRGFYPVLSMTEGIIEQVGWLEKGGWRIGIRAPLGAYFYYAHLYQYSREWKVGDKVKPGTLLGYMGDSGYGVKEGTVGNFAVHLHLGIYLTTDHYQEMSINPYWVLRYSERFIRKADY